MNDDMSFAATAPETVSLEDATTPAQLHADRATRAMGFALGAVQLAAKGPSADLISEFSALQWSVFERIQSLGERWSRDWQHWFRYATHWRGANTMSKLAEREANIVSQMTQLLGSQMSDLVNLQENIEINYAYWLSQKLEHKPAKILHLPGSG